MRDQTLPRNTRVRGQGHSLTVERAQWFSIKGGRIGCSEELPHNADSGKRGAMGCAGVGEGRARAEMERRAVAVAVAVASGSARGGRVS